MSAAYFEGVSEQLPKAQISFDRFHVIAMANDAFNEVRKADLRVKGRGGGKQWARTGKKISKRPIGQYRRSRQVERKADEYHVLSRD